MDSDGVKKSTNFCHREPSSAKVFVESRMVAKVTGTANVKNLFMGEMIENNESEYFGISFF